MTSAKSSQIVLVTCSTITEARKIASGVVRKRLAACVNIVLGPVHSIYRWKEKVEHAREHLLLIKTTKDRLAELEREVTRLHSYDVPEFIVLKIASGSAAYLRWLAASTHRK